MSQLQQNLSQALELSQKICTLAQEAAWSEMEQADRQRITLLESIFSDADFQLKSDHYEPQLRKIVDLNEQALVFCADARGKLNRQGKSLKVGRQALSAYKKNSFD
ncbi:MAG: hypothetical protein N0C88_13925 [Candidatus Thiodiazotropha lotti]|uniref:Flagellar protein FliT n=1 Tax=Candidatus Thiodiazotropha lotti TaxID=2792787 RepID=A0A9E4K7T0_9GAMM|nr:hypothetical protein [Candidatus Thiodiazotropha lotti]ODC01608.1 hypothetical protein A3197_03825 [Candidatus Thiodiazotropha endoloripes]MCG7939929.1 hypothetical protein [Candidatus Thiodiazotropha lotti]MCG7987643.1 hypothetical protein [Candidatus Thiodiazotropha lotti]MCG8014344.1 hypothetical protein [Candidatus Thiodiazotropha lotti]